MSNGLKLVKGMKDVLPTEMHYWHTLESHLRALTRIYGYEEIRMPILEQTQLFCRAIGEVTDIVEKEMYTFVDKGEDQLTMRPEGTAGCVRAVTENGLLRSQSQRLWYMGPMFRRERPQKGRYRQFTQFGLEAYGLEGPDIDAEQMLFCARLWRMLGLENKVTLQINSLGTSEERLGYREALITYLQKCPLDEDSQRRLNSNPLRILDSKNPDMAAVIREAPVLLDYLGEASLAHFEGLQHCLTQAGVKFEINPRLVRGLDYYTHSVFEWVTSALGSQGTVCAGGRYNGLVAQLGGPATPAVGISMGLERLILLMQVLHEENPVSENIPDAYFISQAPSAMTLSLGEKIRDALPGFKMIVHCGGNSFKSQFKQADKSGARFAIIVGEDEIKNQTFTLKELRGASEQQTVAFEALITQIKSRLNEGESHGIL